MKVASVSAFNRASSTDNSVKFRFENKRSSWAIARFIKKVSNFVGKLRSPIVFRSPFKRKGLESGMKFDSQIKDAKSYSLSSSSNEISSIARGFGLNRKEVVKDGRASIYTCHEGELSNTFAEQASMPKMCDQASQTDTRLTCNEEMDNECAKADRRPPPPPPPPPPSQPHKSTVSLSGAGSTRENASRNGVRAGNERDQSSHEKLMKELVAHRLAKDPEGDEHPEADRASVANDSEWED
ncbi:hypothetical protein [Burkholderia ubonensis]|uniref:hypothetical protein n=1 Tax=Burkholderia ubonensis TaxID=101571 RepID=UPI001160C8A6|nr:hypothetical protein [Burkholderia ubonensis]